MIDPTVLSMIIGVGVVILFGGLGLVMSRSSDSRAEERLAGLVGQKKAKAKKADLAGGILARPAAIDLGRPSFWTRMIPNAENLNLLYEQADVSMTFRSFLVMVGGLAVAGLVVGVAFQLPIYAIPVGSAFLGCLPFLWLLRRRSQTDQAIRHGHARGGRADQPGAAGRPQPGLGPAPGRRGDEGPDRRRVQPRLRGAESRHARSSWRCATWPTGSLDGRPVLRDRGDHPAVDRRRPRRGARQDRPADPPAIRAVRPREGPDRRGAALRGASCWRCRRPCWPSSRP